MNGVIVASLIALLLCATAVAKVLWPSAFLAVLRDVFPERWIGVVRWGVISIEITLVVILISDPPFGAGLTLLFIAGATIVVSQRLSKHDGFFCGCWGGKLRGAPRDAARSSIGPLLRLLIQNSLVFQAALWVALSGVGRWNEAIGVIGLAIVPSILAIAIISDIVRRKRMLAGRHPEVSTGAGER